MQWGWGVEDSGCPRRQASGATANQEQRVPLARAALVHREEFAEFALRDVHLRR